MQDTSFSDEVNVYRLRLASLLPPPASSSPRHDASVSLLTKNINAWISLVLRTRVSMPVAKRFDSRSLIKIDAYYVHINCTMIREKCQA